RRSPRDSTRRGPRHARGPRPAPDDHAASRRGTGGGCLGATGGCPVAPPAAAARHACDERRGRRPSRIGRAGGAESRRTGPGRRSCDGAAPARPAPAGTRRTGGPPAGGEDGAIAWSEELDLVIEACSPAVL